MEVLFLKRRNTVKLIPLSSRRAYLLLSSIVLVALVAACGGGSTSGPPAPTQSIQKTSTATGDSQTAAVTAPLANPLRVLVTLNGTPQAGKTVTWASSAVGSTISPGGNTDVNGIATANWTLGQTAGTETATATLSGATGSPVTFTATATPGPATQLASVSGDNQTGPVNSTLPNPLQVKVADAFGNGVRAVTVSWLVTSGSATVMPASGPTDASGTAQATLTLGGTAGSNTITATSTGLTGSPVTFHATAVVLPMTAAVTVGPGILFKSVRNGTSNPAVDTIRVGGTVTWTWAAGSLLHSVQSTGSPSFLSSGIQTSGTYSNTFSTAGDYAYDCAVHGAAMNGVIVVR
jgi:plastocyanin